MINVSFCFTVVHFEKDDTGKPVRHVEMETEEVIEPEPYKSPEESMHEIVDAQKRKLDQWCFAEHYEKPTLLQVRGHNVKSDNKLSEKVN